MSAPLSVDEVARLRALMRSTPWAALATCDEHGPNGAMVAVAWQPSQSCAWLHLSQLALHTRQLLAQPRACLVWSESAVGVADPQTLLRVSVRVDVTVVARGEAAYASAREAYCARLPASAPLFGFGDFVLFRAVPTEIRAVFGFARALNLNVSDWFEGLTS